MSNQRYVFDKKTLRDTCNDWRLHPVRDVSLGRTGIGSGKPASR